MNLNWANATGGIGYHLGAVLQAQSNWQLFRQQILKWLNEWPIAPKQILLIGPSAGHCLPFEWLGKFEKITILEPDSIGRWWFLRRMVGYKTKVHFLQLPKTVTSESTFKAGSQNILNALAIHPDTPVLFANVIGQLPLFANKNHTHFEKEWASFKIELNEQLSNRNWASFHDRLSSSTAPTRNHLYTSCSLNDEDLIQSFWSEIVQKTFSSHGTSGFFAAELPAGYLHWPITKNQHHVVELKKSKLQV